MIYVSRLNGKTFVVNCELIEFIEVTPNTVISMTTGKKIVVSESIDEVINRIIEYKKKILVKADPIIKNRRNEV